MDTYEEKTPLANVVAEDRTYRNRIKTSEAADAYLQRKKFKHNAEMRLVQRGLEYCSKGSSILDAPCGNGRMTFLLAKQGYLATGTDLSDATLAICSQELARLNLNGDFLKRDIEALDLLDNQFENTLCFRFFHHLPTSDARARVISELCRVTRRTVLISYFSPFSPTMLKRNLRFQMGGKQSHQYATRLSELKEYFKSNGFEFKKDLAQMRYFKSLHLACFVAS
jgi:SAM-dependent methyltransferase